MHFDLTDQDLINEHIEPELDPSAFAKIDEQPIEFKSTATPDERIPEL